MGLLEILAPGGYLNHRPWIEGNSECAVENAELGIIKMLRQPASLHKKFEMNKAVESFVPGPTLFSDGRKFISPSS